MTRTIYTDNPKKSYDGKYFLKNDAAVPTNSVNGSKDFINLKVSNQNIISINGQYLFHDKNKFIN